MYLQACILEGGFNQPVPLCALGIIAAVPVDARRLAFLNQPGEYLQRISAEDIQLALQALIQRLQCMMQPPVTGTARRVLLVIIENINRDYLASLAGSDQGRIIRQAQVLPEP